MLSATEDETVALIKKAKTDTERHITYDPSNRPEVSNLINLIALASGTSSEAVAQDIGDGGAAQLKKVLAETINEYLRPFRARRKEIESDMGYITAVLKAGIKQARSVGEQTLLEVRRVMNMEL